MAFSRSPAIAGAFLFACMVSVTPASAQTALAPVGALSGDQASGFDVFGGSMASDQNWLFVAAPREVSSRGMPDGAVYIYKRQSDGSYAFAQKLPGTQTSVSGGDRYGAGVAVANGWLFIAAANNQDFPGLTDPRDADDPAEPFIFAGKVFVYRLQGGGWTLSQTLQSPAPGTFGAFAGRSLSNHLGFSDNGDILVVGEPGNYPNATGKAHVFQRQGQNWSLKQSLALATDTATSDFFAGDSVVALPQNRFAIEVEETTLDGGGNPVSAQGRIHVYKLQGNKLAETPEQVVAGGAYDANGCAANVGAIAGMAAGGNVFAFTEPCADGAAGAEAGKMIVFNYSAGGAQRLILQQTIEGTIPAGRLGFSLFGGQETVSVDSHGKRILVGSTIATFGDPAAVGVDVLLYAKSGQAPWTATHLLQPTVSGPFRGFGMALAFGHQATGLAFVGEASAGTGPGPSPGEVLIYSVGN